NTRGVSNTERVIAAEALALASPAGAQTVVTIGIGTQDTTTDTATAGTPAQSAGEILPKDGKYANIKFELEWQRLESLGKTATRDFTPSPCSCLPSDEGSMNI